MDVCAEVFTHSSFVPSSRGDQGMHAAYQPSPCLLHYDWQCQSLLDPISRRGFDRVSHLPDCMTDACKKRGGASGKAARLVAVHLKPVRRRSANDRHFANLNAWTTSHVAVPHLNHSISSTLPASVGVSSQCAVQAGSTPQTHITSKGMLSCVQPPCIRPSILCLSILGVFSPILGISECNTIC